MASLGDAKSALFEHALDEGIGAVGQALRCGAPIIGVEVLELGGRRESFEDAASFRASRVNLGGQNRPLRHELSPGFAFIDGVESPAVIRSGAHVLNAAERVIVVQIPKREHLRETLGCLG